MHETPLIATIATSLLVAFGAGWMAVKLRLPPLIGYLLAGIALGPSMPGNVVDVALAQELADIGVILLMFGVGLHLSLQDLWAVRWIAVPGATAQIAVATTIGTLLATAWGWSLPAGIVFGLSLSVASTVVLLRALEERNAIQSLNGHIAIGWMIVEDLAMVFALVLLPALSLAGNGVGGAGVLAALGLTIGKLAIFIVLVLAVGRRAVPFILDRVARHGSRELFTLAVLALALGIAYLSAVLFGVSLALGAFFAGVIMSESDLSHQATADSLPMKEAFAVLFFVSMGMLFDPRVLIEEPLAVIAVLLVIVVGKSLAAFAIVLLFRYPLSTALMVSASLAQIGEFSFILTTMGLSLGVLPPEAQTLVLAGALLSIALNPVAFGTLEAVEHWIRSHPRLMVVLDRSRHDRPADLPAEHQGRLQGHAIIVGLGRVGETVSQAFDRLEVGYVVVEQNRRRVHGLRKRGLPVVWGDATVRGVLDKAGIGTARLLVCAIPDGFQARQVVDLARAANPNVDLVARTHSDRERQYLERRGVGMAAMGERELAFSMMGYALRSVGIHEDVVKLVVGEFRRDYRQGGGPP